MRQFLLVCVGAGVLSLAGCDLQPPGVKKVGAPGGLAPADLDIANPGSAAPPAAPPVAQQPPVNPAAPAAPPAAPPKESIINKTTNTVVNYNDYRNDPNWKVIENKASGDDPLTFAASAYVSARSRASTFGMEAAIKQIKVVEERNPSYDELLQIMKENRVEFTAVYAWQTYAYDPMNGHLMVIENSQMKADRYKAAGITE